jgi:hypothetical protein
MGSSLNHPLTGTIYVDEFMAGGPEENKKGRSKGLKKTHHSCSRNFRRWRWTSLC